MLRMILSLDPWVQSSCEAVAIVPHHLRDSLDTRAPSQNYDQNNGQGNHNDGQDYHDDHDDHWNNHHD